MRKIFTNKTIASNIGGRKPSIGDTNLLSLGHYAPTTALDESDESIQTTVFSQIIGEGSAPSIAISSNAGTSATAAITSAESSNVAGRFTFTTGSGSVTIGTWITVTFAIPYTIIPIVQLFPDRTKSDVGGNNASLLVGNYSVSVNVSLTGFTIHVNVDPSAITNARHDFNYITIGSK